ncbi:MAG: UvrABC system protein A [Alphaproteobacteria bacterium MarineAlpha5_Bin5]|nr:MAG: UvrABC system protein A [Alphaproteobacteria bacterium MarineAlpha5_Bin5]
MIQDKIVIKGAREHNLKNINLEIPKNKLIVITGVSGSGKSTLAFDTIYSEGQRKYVESLSAYARQFLQMMNKPDVDTIEGLSPAISIEQKTTQKNPRSTVGTVTEIYDYLRVLFARVGIPYSPKTGKPIKSQTVSEICDSIIKKNLGNKIYILSPIVRDRKGEYKKEIDELKKKGFQRLKIDNIIYDIDDSPKLKKNFKHNIDVLIDRLIIKKNIQKRLTDSIEIALSLSDGLIYIENLDNNTINIYSSKFACPVSGFSIEEIEPRLFSFNAPQGACNECDGLGVEKFFDEKKIIPDDSRSIIDGAIKPWETKVFGNQKKYFLETINNILKLFNINKKTSWNKIPKKVKELLLYGDENNEVNLINDFEGIINFIDRKYSETERWWIQFELEKYLSERDCEICNGFRLNEKALAIKIDNIHIGELTKKTIDQALNWFDVLTKKLDYNQKKIAEGIIKEIKDRLIFLNRVGLDYLTLSRSSKTLSGGESQRIRLASQIGSGLTGVLYVLDEPSIGLHQKDNNQLIKTLFNLRDLGNTVIVVEHDEEAIRKADHIIDIGIHAGVNGGSIVAEGKIQNIINNKKSLTGQYLSKLKEINIPKKRRIYNKNKLLTLNKIETNNLKNLNVTFPLGNFICVTGVSGSGKSSLIIDTLYKRLDEFFNKSLNKNENNFNIKGINNIDKVIDINQSPIGRTPRSNPATYTGCFTPIRDWFSNLNESNARGYKPGRFSFNVKGGRCESCEGDGVKKIEMHFLADVYVECDVCKGKRYNRETLEVKYNNKSIADILDMTVEEGYRFFEKIPNIKQKLQTLMEVGLHYIKIGQSATTLSGGEAQRIKLSKELSKRSTGKTLYILDEPTTGLHFDDVKKLLSILHKLVDEGNTVIVIEHNLDIIKTADHIIDLGPLGGNKGGKIIFEGSLEKIIIKKNNFTGQYLKKHLT